MSQRVVLASNNAGKLAELRELLAPLGLNLVAQANLGIPEAEEPHPTFVENSLAKARHAARLSGLPAIADDSGLCVAALGGAPGVKSARFAGDEDRTTRDASNNARLIMRLQDKVNRRAWFYCSMVFLRHADDPQPLIGEGFWHGEIVTRPLGEHGFGYDPHFWLPELGCTAAQLDSATKNTLSHRAQATRQLIELLKNA